MHDGEWAQKHTFSSARLGETCHGCSSLHLFFLPLSVRGWRFPCAVASQLLRSFGIYHASHLSARCGASVVLPACSPPFCVACAPLCSRGWLLPAVWASVNGDSRLHLTEKVGTSANERKIYYPQANGHGRCTPARFQTRSCSIRRK